MRCFEPTYLFGNAQFLPADLVDTYDTARCASEPAKHKLQLYRYIS